MGPRLTGLYSKNTVLNESELVRWVVMVIALIGLISIISMTLPFVWSLASEDMIVRVTRALLVVLCTGSWLSFLALDYFRG